MQSLCARSALCSFSSHLLHIGDSTEIELVPLVSWKILPSDAVEVILGNARRRLECAVALNTDRCMQNDDEADGSSNKDGGVARSLKPSALPEATTDDIRGDSPSDKSVPSFFIEHLQNLTEQVSSITRHL